MKKMLSRLGEFRNGVMPGLDILLNEKESLCDDKDTADTIMAIPCHESGAFPNMVTDSTGGSTGVTLASTGPQQTVVIPCQLLDFISGAITLALPFAFTVVSALFRTNKPATTGSKGATLTLSTSGGAVTGGVMTLTSANQNTTGGTAAASAISGTNATVVAGGTVIITPSSVTTFVEGDGWVEVTVTNNDLANTLATLNKLISQLNQVIPR
jgi:hypothetical protein